MCVRQRLMNVGVGVGFSPVPCEIVIVPMVLVMGMRMGVFLILVGMLMRMPLRDVQPDTGPHQHPRSDELQRNGVVG